MLTGTMTNVKPVLEQVHNPNFWLQINPHLTISENLNFQSLAPITLEQEYLQDLLMSLKEEGYFQVDPILPRAEVLQLSSAIEKLRQEGWPPVFGFVYDQFWQIFYRLSPILSAVLGEEYLQIPDIWAWYVDKSKTETGWEPHRDRKENGLLPDGMPKALNVWIPLTDVTPLNGCMYILPADLDPHYNDGGGGFRLNLQDVRALPVSVGSVLCWNPLVLHWGSRSSTKATSPRISIACDFQRNDVEPYEQHLLNPLTPLNFNERLGLIGKLILRFHKRYRYSDQLVQLAVELQKNAALPYWVVGGQYRIVSDRWENRGITRGMVIEIAHLHDDGKVMVRHPEHKELLYPFEFLELEDIQFSSVV